MCEFSTLSALHMLISDWLNMYYALHAIRNVVCVCRWIDWYPWIKCNLYILFVKQLKSSRIFRKIFSLYVTLKLSIKSCYLKWKWMNAFVEIYTFVRFPRFYIIWFQLAFHVGFTKITNFSRAVFSVEYEHWQLSDQAHN